MAKKILLVLLLVTLAAGGTFAQMSVGGGVSLSFNSDSVKGSISGVTLTETIDTTGFSLYGFFDATYVEADIGLLFGSQKAKITTQVSVIGPLTQELDIKIALLTLSVYGKYPIDLGDFTLSPMLGIQMDLGLSAEMGGEKAEGSDLADGGNRFWVKFGASADFNLTETLYLRPSILYGINFGTKNLRDSEKTFKDGGMSVTPFYHGLDIRVAIGFRL